MEYVLLLDATRPPPGLLPYAGLPAVGLHSRRDAATSPDDLKPLENTASCDRLLVIL